MSKYFRQGQNTARYQNWYWRYVQCVQGASSLKERVPFRLSFWCLTMDPSQIPSTITVGCIQSCQCSVQARASRRIVGLSEVLSPHGRVGTHSTSLESCECLLKLLFLEDWLKRTTFSESNMLTIIVAAKLDY